MVFVWLHLLLAWRVRHVLLVTAAVRPILIHCALSCCEQVEILTQQVRRGEEVFSVTTLFLILHGVSYFTLCDCVLIRVGCFWEDGEVWG